MWASVRLASVPLPLGIRSHSTRLKVISSLSFSIMKFSVQLCRALAVYLLDRGRLSSALLASCTPSVLLTWQWARRSGPRVGIHRGHQGKGGGAAPWELCFPKWTQGGFWPEPHLIVLSQASIKWIQILPWESQLRLRIWGSYRRKQEGGSAFRASFFEYPGKVKGETHNLKYPKTALAPLSSCPIDFIWRIPIRGGIWGDLLVTTKSLQSCE